MEPVIGHLKAEHRMGRNYSTSKDAPATAPMPFLAAAGYTSCCAANRMRRRIASPGNVPETSSVASPSVLPLPH